MTPRQQKFVAAYAEHGIGERAAIEAGYAGTTARAQSARLLANVGIADALAIIAEDAHTEAVADIAEVRSFWSATMRDGKADTRDRLKASELLAKASGQFVQRIDQTNHYVSNPGGKSAAELVLEALNAADAEDAAAGLH